MIPKIVHFIFGLNSDFGHRPFSLIHNIAIKSAHDVIKPDKIFLYYKYKPCNNKYWDDITHLVELVEIEPPDEIFGNPIEHFAHKTCVTRLKKLIEFGGIYLDCDTLCINSFDNLLNNSPSLKSIKNSFTFITIYLTEDNKRSLLRNFLI